MWYEACKKVQILIEQGDYEKALIELQYCLDEEKEIVQYFASIIYYYLNQIDKSIEHCHRLLNIRPDLYEMQYHLAACYGFKDDLVNSYKYFESRFKLNSTFALYHQRFKDKYWDGIQTGEVLFVYHEQGIGDLIQYLRFIPLLKKYFKRVVLETPQELVGLILPHHGVDIVVPRCKMPLPSSSIRCDYAVSLGSVAHLLKIDKNSIEKTPYIYYSTMSTSHTSVRPFRLTETGKKIGVCWLGSKSFQNDKYRSMPLEDFICLKNQGVVYNLTLEPSPFINFNFYNFQETANVISQLDLVVTVDTAVAHLTGAMNKPCLLFLGKFQDWRWGKGETTYWYPSIKIIRQPFKEFISKGDLWHCQSMIS